MSYFEAVNLYKKFEHLTLEFSMSAEKGTMTSLLGSSGSGKSTVLKIIAGFTPNDRKDYSIKLDSKSIEKAVPQKRNLGMVFQSPALFTNMNVIENISYGLRCSGIKKKAAQEEAAEFMKKFNLSGLEYHRAETLSGGEAQRVCLARTLIVKPKLVLFDEPLSALDTPLRKKLSEDIAGLQKDLGFTGILVTHDLEEAKKMSSKIICLEKGKITFSGNACDFEGQA